MAFPLRTDNQAHDLMALADPSTHPSHPLAFGTNDLASYNFAPLDLGLGYSVPFGLPMQDQAPLGFGTGELASYDFSPNIAMASTYAPPVPQLSPFFRMGLGSAVAGNAMPGGARFTGPHNAPLYGDGASLAKEPQIPAIEFAHGDAVDGLNAASSLGPLAIACSSLGTAVADADRLQPSQSVATVDDWFDFDRLLNDMQSAGADAGTTATSPALTLPAVKPSYIAPKLPRAAAPAVGPSVTREASPDIDSEQPTTWLEGGELFWHSAEPPHQSDLSAARTSPTVASPDWGVGDSAFTGPSTASRHYYDVYATNAPHNEQLGLHVQEDNTPIAPAVTGLQPEIAHPATTSRKTAARATVPSKAGRSSKVREQKTAKAKSSQAMMPHTPDEPKNPFRRVPWAKTERGQMCKERGLTKHTRGPFQCFICVEHNAPGASTQYAMWDTFKSHVGRCAPVETMRPRCHFCNAPVRGYGRPHQMERHLVGYAGYAPCKALAELVLAGKKTHYEIGAWLKARNLPILPEFVGTRLAKAFHWAVYNKYERDTVADLTPQHRKKKAVEDDEEEEEEDDDDEDED